ncbi:hypothetical protein Ndes2526B_g01161 [Nannochloris sp. 'desiccata']|nr:putative glutathione peroxidase 7, chloroplastic [Chlorella desiccata (nom. nud.)]
MKVVARSTVASRSAFAGARITTRRAPKAAVSRSAVRTMALFGGASKTAADSIYNIKVTNIDGKEIKMSQYKGKALLIVNVASACGMTPQYSSLVALYDKYKSKGFEIIAFPCNAFGKQESGENCEIKAFAQRKGAKFTMLEKGEVNGPNEAPLYTFLKDKKGGLLGKDIPWNFSKFLVDKNGTVVKRFAPTDDPLNFEKDIVALL